MNSKKQRILIIGSGGREHAVGWKVMQSPKVEKIFFAPGNAGTKELGTNIDIKATDIDALLDFAKKERIDLTLALPDDPLALGIVDTFQKENLKIWGPTKNASKIEWSKAYAKGFMKRYNIPTARYQVFTNYDTACQYIETQSYPLVIKASGLALGKGVIIVKNKNEATKTLEDILINKIFGTAGDEVVIEEYLVGTEISIHAFSDGKNYKLFPTSQDHKRIRDNDEGPNTGGMGTIAPLRFIDIEMLKRIEEEIIAPAIEGMLKDGNPFVGCLYPGIMLTNDGPKVFEFNARLGDPETQTYMRLLDTDLLEIIEASLEEKLNEIEIKWKDLSACTVMLASAGYPGNYEKGKVITGLEKIINKDIIVFHSGTKIENLPAQTGNNLITNGGRVLGISATGVNLKEALEAAYGAIKEINFNGMQYRSDIGKKAL